ncbi:unnamed protein product [Chrysoparadoxa australica]
MHPEKADLEHLDEMLQLIRDNQSRCVCVGEVGLDYSPHVIGPKGQEADLKKGIQRRVLTAQAELALELSLPVNCHSRAAGHHTVELLQGLGVKKALLHAFDGKPVYAEAGAKAGYKFSVPPNVARSPGLQKLVQRLPLSSLVLETDCPALAPVQGEMNVPANLTVSCEWIAKLKGVHEKDVVAATTQNAKELFPAMQW